MPLVKSEVGRPTKRWRDDMYVFKNTRPEKTTQREKRSGKLSGKLLPSSGTIKADKKNKISLVSGIKKKTKIPNEMCQASSPTKI